jgi:DNA-binding NarL/FixJ family response regulator
VGSRVAVAFDWQDVMARRRPRAHAPPARASRNLAADKHELPAPRDLRASKLETSTREILVLSYQLASPTIPDGLTAAEREVLAGILGGQSNAAIARGRRTAVWTVANQVASIFRKLRVASRAELVSVLFGSNARDPPGGA